MSRRYQEQVEVRLGDPVEHRVRLEPGWRRGTRTMAEVPTLFLWQGRVHVVRGVLAQWTQRLPWWRDLGTGSTDADSLEQEVWRVEASAGRTHEMGVYDLVHGGRWLLERVSD
ncbi:DUF6504 family protein [Ornithinimicrobium cerasi]|uniref:DUF6504 domain-containing protein n=1 Tax=Ornithinimicrobium cerasi TaxID=2248773 RepID=A0A285VGG6_9MICO|nr:DUF6504 family protein [Ornithinimicrobium cerasi]SOC51631.1 hypothetical protein SAMN05421879_101258 [Ornithinimicrobium cerasi]